MANRLAHNPKTKHIYGPVITDGKWNGKTHFVESALEKPFHWKKPRRIFVCSMGDLFHESVPFEWIDKIINVIRWAKQHTFLFLTKRPERMYEYFNSHVPKKYIMDNGNILDNLWLGVTSENQEQADKRIPILFKIPAAKRFVSIEPMLGSIDITQKRIDYSVPTRYEDNGNGIEWTDPGNSFIGLDWVICGGESGPNARPVHPDWVRSVRDQCQAANVPFIFKQWGEFIPSYSAGYYSEELDQWMKSFGDAWVRRSVTLDDGMVMVKVGKKKAGRKLDGKIWNEYPGE